MSKFSIYSDSGICEILVEKSAYEGVKLVAQAHAEDIKLCCGKMPKIVSEPESITEKRYYRRHGR